MKKLQMVANFNLGALIQIICDIKWIFLHAIFSITAHSFLLLCLEGRDMKEKVFTNELVLVKFFWIIFICFFINFVNSILSLSTAKFFFNLFLINVSIIKKPGHWFTSEN